MISKKFSLNDYYCTTDKDKDKLEHYFWNYKDCIYPKSTA